MPPKECFEKLEGVSVECGQGAKAKICRDEKGMIEVVCEPEEAM